MVCARLGEPQIDELPQLVGLLICEVVKFGRVDLDVVELPGVVVEVAPAADRRVWWRPFAAVKSPQLGFPG